MRNLVASRWFALANLACAVTAAAWWVAATTTAAHQASAWPLVIALIPWGLRVAAGKFPVQRTLFDIPLAIFLLTAGVGVWAAYDRAAAWNKFWLIVAAVLLYYGLAAFKHHDIWIAIGFISTCGAVLAAYFIRFPSSTESETVAGILIVIFPFTVAWGYHRWRQRQIRWAIVTMVIAGLLALSLLVYRERGVWLGLIFLAVCLPLARWLNPLLTAKRWRMLLITCAIGCTILAGAALLVFMRFPEVLENLPGSFRPRVEELVNTTYLAVEFPFMGGGLGASAGLYSRYILVIPYFFSPNSHNLFLDIGVEQGWFGLIALIWIWAGSGWIAVQNTDTTQAQDHKGLRVAVLCSLLLMVLHNLTDDALYNAQGIAGLLILPGLSFAAMHQAPRPARRREPAAVSIRKHPRAIIAGCAAVMVVALGLWRSIAAVFYANLGVIEMARVHLAGWPAEIVGGERLLAGIDPAEISLQKAIQLNPQQATALYRLGMIATERRDYEQAGQFLSRAYEVYPTHNGIRKVLGYSFLWLGNVNKSAGLLKPDTETLKELDAYTYWWKTQNREDLSSLAAQLAVRLREK